MNEKDSELEFSKRQIEVFNEATLKQLPREGCSSVQSKAILEKNQKLRETSNSWGSALGWGYLALSIPPAHMVGVLAIHPGLASHDQTVKKAAVMAALKDPRMAPYKVRTRDGFRQRVY